jgi:GNAT superfamily N-acetyltransferase
MIRHPSSKKGHAVSVPASLATARHALEENLWSMWGQFGQGPLCTLHRDDGLLWFETPLPVLPYNMVVRFQVTAEPDRAIDAMFEHFRSRGVPFLWFLHPSAAPADLGARLSAHGFEELEEIAGMVADLDELPAAIELPRGVQIHEVNANGALIPFMELVATRWSVPESARPQLRLIADSFRIGSPGSPNRAWLAVRDGAPLAKVFSHEGAGVVGLYGMATQNQSRGLGLGRILCITALAAARSRGHRIAVLHSTPMARALYRRVGFRDVAAFRLYGAPQSFYA